MRQLSVWTVVAVYAQLILGATLRHSKEGLLWHLLGALVVTFLIVWTVARVYKYFADVSALSRPAMILGCLAGRTAFFGSRLLSCPLDESRRRPARCLDGCGNDSARRNGSCGFGYQSSSRTSVPPLADSSKGKTPGDFSSTGSHFMTVRAEMAQVKSTALGRVGAVAVVTPALKAHQAAASSEAIQVKPSKLSDYLCLTKPEVTFLVLIATALGGFMAVPSPDVLLLCHAVFGTALVAGGTAALNHYVEREHDAKMRRTANRPLPSGRLSALEALMFGAGDRDGGHSVPRGFSELAE